MRFVVGYFQLAQSNIQFGGTFAIACICIIVVITVVIPIAVKQVFGSFLSYTVRCLYLFLKSTLVFYLS
jgi:hypothetical protein